MVIVERLRELPIGTKITATVETYFGGHAEVKCEITGPIEHHGYIHEGGSWGLYKIYEADKECYRILVRNYRKRHNSWLKLGFTMKDFSIGW